ncbi:MAG: hypothetical protein GY759_19695 [Chloroflexi bacterium]|nr:hypothetical protein [Chloroflexota bacterium]
MDYGSLFADTLRLLWRQKKLWVLGMLGMFLSATGVAIYLGIGLSSYFRIVSMIVDPSMFESVGEYEIYNQFFGNIAILLGGLGAMVCLSVLGYIITLVTRGGIIGEASLAWEGEQVAIRRGLRTGIGRVLAMFAIDVLWYLPIMLFIGCVYVVGLGAVFGIGSGFGKGLETGEPGATIVLLSSIIGLIGIVLCLSLVLAIAQGVFAPMMYQSTVQDRRSLGDAIREGWSLARASLGTMVILLIIVFGMTLLTGFITQIAMSPLMGIWMSSGFATMMSFTQDIPPASPGPLNSVLLVFGSILVGVVTMVVSGFMQAFKLTLYARAYQLLKDDGTDSESDLSLSVLE